ncbi:MAG: rod shape-determining protein MreC [Betaproteobacteria bacterium]|jgi:rod shape-determining protein MreC|nr:rod shape-determining protein MreC [Betaproteobacteria bacterium]MDH4294557.1 rod shape-determining protein MreC [Betaproteobacteria bacterium]MDH5343100.1 rod shape-determining protein MreC [Betaproteobacteria bacterium]
MEHTPPPLFRTGPTPLARLMIFAMLSVVLLIADARFNYLTVLRQITAVVIYPLQRLAAAPAAMGRRVSDFFVSHSALRDDNQRLTEQNLALAQAAQQARALEQENANLRGLLEARARISAPSRFAEILYAARDPFSRKVMIDQGLQHGIQPGQPVGDHIGIIGQVTRVYAWLSEVTLITDKGHLVPVLNLRTGLRAVLAGTGDDGRLELRFIPLTADFQTGDQLVTSGIDGVYPPGLPVAEVINVERNTAYLFANVTCKPLAGVNARAQVLVLGPLPAMTERPQDAPADTPKKKKKKS